MNGMEKMTKKEMEMVTGGKCNSDYGYFFCCPANADDMVATIKNLMNSGQKDKASRKQRGELASPLYLLGGWMTV